MVLQDLLVLLVDLHQVLVLRDLLVLHQVLVLLDLLVLLVDLHRVLDLQDLVYLEELDLS